MWLKECGLKDDYNNHYVEGKKIEQTSKTHNLTFFRHTFNKSWYTCMAICKFNMQIEWMWQKVQLIVKIENRQLSKLDHYYILVYNAQVIQPWM